MRKEYNSDPRQSQAKYLVENLRLKNVMAENDLHTESDGIDKLVDLIEEQTPTCPRAFRSDDKKVDFLRRAVIACPWAEQPITQIVLARYKFNDFVLALREATNLDIQPKEAALVTRRMHTADGDTSYEKYGRHPGLVQKHDRPIARTFAVQVKPYYVSDTLAHSFMLDLEKGFQKFGHAGDEDADDVFITEIITKKDPRATSKEMTEAKKTEIRNLLKRGTFKVTLKEDVLPVGNVLPGRFLLAPKSTEDGEIKHKTRYGDGLIRAGGDDFKDLVAKTNEKFDMADNEHRPCTLTGFDLKTCTNGTITIDQNAYLKMLEELPLDFSFFSLRSMRMRLAWLSYTRLDCQFESSQLVQITEDIIDMNQTEYLKRLNRAVNLSITHRYSLKFPKLHLKSLRVIGFSDSSFANNDDISSQLGYICFMGEETERAIPIVFNSYKSRGVTRSPMAGEVIAFSDMFDVAGTMSEEVGFFVNRRTPVQLFTDSKILFDVISKGSGSSEKRMMFDIAAARQGFKAKVISDIGFVRSSKHSADGLIKVLSQENLNHPLATDRLRAEPEQCIIWSLGSLKLSFIWNNFHYLAYLDFCCSSTTTLARCLHTKLKRSRFSGVIYRPLFHTDYRAVNDHRSFYKSYKQPPFLQGRHKSKSVTCKFLVSQCC